MRNFRTLCIALSAGVTLCFSTGAAALPAMDVQIDVLMAQQDDLAQTLKLNNNQQILWRQTAAKIHAILDERRRRRERLQSDLKRGLEDPRTELRDLAKAYDTEAELSHREDKDMRELFLTVNDALDDKQRQAVLVALDDQLQRVLDRGEPRNSEQPRSRGTGRPHGGAQGAPGGSGGPPQQ